MSLSRTTSIKNIMREQFKNETRATEIKNDMRDKLDGPSGMASRVFDKCDRLLPDAVLKQLTNQFIKILSEVKIDSLCEHNDLPEKLTLINEKNEMEFDEWIQEIASMAIYELLDVNGHIKREIIQLFEWDEFRTKLGMTRTTFSILCGYISRVFLDVTVMVTSKEIEKYNHGLAYFALGNYLKKPEFNKDNIEKQKLDKSNMNPEKSNLDRLIIQALDAKGIAWIERDRIVAPTKLPAKLKEWSSERRDIGSFMVVGTIERTPSYDFSYSLFGKKAKTTSSIEIQELKSRYPR